MKSLEVLIILIIAFFILLIVGFSKELDRDMKWCEENGGRWISSSASTCVFEPKDYVEQN